VSDSVTGGDQPPTADDTTGAAQTVRVLPSGVEIEVAAGETVMAAAQRAGYRWPTVCGGQGMCRTCTAEVRECPERCSAIGELEREGIEALKRPTTGDTRLACQVEVTGPGVVLFKRGVRPASR
jgi:ferredoxin